MQSQLKAIRVEQKGKSASKLSASTEELQFLLDFNSSICQAMAKSMEHLTDFVFVNVANVTLLRRDSYLAYLKAGIKADTLAALRTAPLHLHTLFPDSVIKQAEDDIASFDKGRSTRKVGTTLTNVQRASRITESKRGRLGRIYHVDTTDAEKGSISFHHDLPRPSSLINDNYCVNLLQERLLAGSTFSTKTDNELFKVRCKLSCCKSCLYCPPGFCKRKM